MRWWENLTLDDSLSGVPKRDKMQRKAHIVSLTASEVYIIAIFYKARTPQADGAPLRVA